MQFQKTILKNNLRLITAPLKNTQTVTILIMVQAGSKYETKAIGGISHFLEHMFFKGTKKRPSTLAIASELDAMGVEYNAFTHKEYTGYWIKAHQNKLDSILEVISDMFQNSLLAPSEIEREKMVILEEMKMYQDLPMQYVGCLFEKLLYGNQPAGRMIIGEKESVLSINREKLINYLQDHYGAQETIILVAGNLQNSQIEEKIQARFNLIKDKSKARKLKVKEQQTRSEVLLHPKNTDQTHLIIGARTIDFFHPDKYTAAIFATILGGNMSSRLFIKIRERMGLAYYIKAENETYTDSGYLAIQAGVDNSKVEQAIQAIINELKLIKEQGVDQKELQKAKDYLKGSLYLNLETSDEIAFWLGEQEAAKEEILLPQEVERKLDAVKKEDLQRFVLEHFIGEKFNLALIGPIDNDEKIKNIIDL